MTRHKERIIFLDIDGPMIPLRCAYLPEQTRIMTVFDPVAVSLLNQLCKEQGWKIVLHTSWVRIQGGKRTKEHCILQGILPEYFHEDSWCDEDVNWRYTRIAKWLEDHPNITEYVILDDEPYQDDIYTKHPHPEDLSEHLILIDYVEGLMYKHYRDIYLMLKKAPDD
jgi:hypothetical protein